LHAGAGARLVRDPSDERSGRRFVASARRHGLDLRLMWGVLGGEGGTEVRQVCLAVPGAGRTAMLFLSGPIGVTGEDAESDHLERVAILQHAERDIIEQETGIRLLQALPEPHETWASRAYTDAGFIAIGQLSYQRLLLRNAACAEPGPLPEGVELRSITSLGPGSKDRELLAEALLASYVDTLDCPELCGLREIDDVLESHMATGQFDPSLWWIVTAHGVPRGCLLLSHVPQQETVELVYLGLAPSLRGMGLGGVLMAKGVSELRAQGHEELTCAVDVRNAPARRLYAHVGFSEFAARVAHVLPVRRP
jgi:ribosomal protein S18 acetylase RimI-like enzyme